MRATLRPLALFLALGLAAALPSPAQEAPETPEPAQSPAEAPPDAASGATAATESGGKAGRPFLGFKSETAFHKAAGWGSAGLLLAAGVVGAVRAWDLMSAGHEYRDDYGIDEDEIGSACSAKITEVWKADQTLRWVHVGLVVSGETLYLADAVTGVSWIDPSRPASLRSKLHRWAFYGHAALMLSEIVLGFLTTDALERGDHELVSSLGVAHVAIGFAIPLAIGAAGAIEVWPGGGTAEGR